MKNILLALFICVITPRLAFAATPVVISKPTSSNAQDIKFFSDLESFNCSKTDSGTSCIGEIKPENIVAWGAGFCRDTKKQLTESINKGSVVLTANGQEIKPTQIQIKYQSYKRSHSAHCQTWLVNLSNWVPGTTTHLTAIVTYHDRPKYSESIIATVLHNQ
ncbi:hypothetical protein [Sideroxyarcus sp. TK5]